MDDSELKRRLRDSLESMQGDDAPAFDTLWAIAETRYGNARSRYQQLIGLAAAAAVAAIAFMIWPLNGNNGMDHYLTEQDLMMSTQWLAPSDVLLPQHRIDIYGELPLLIETNESDEGSVL